VHPRPTNGGFDYPNRLGNAIDAIDRRLKGNLVVNGAFQIWQRGTSIASSGSVVVYTADRWAFYRTGVVTGGTVSRQAGGNATYCMRIQRDNGNASVATLNVTQSMESLDCAPYRSRFVMAKFRARCGANYSAAASNFTLQLASGTGTDESIHAAFTGAAVQATKTVVLTTSFQDFETVPVVMPSNMNELALVFSWIPVGTAGAADYAEIEEVQLVFGEYAGEFPYRSIAEELTIARRYCRVEDFRVPATTAVSERINMRAVPSIAGGGAGYTSTGTTKDALVHFQTTGAVQTLTLSADI
jgi:hypothetical protein